MNATKIRPMSNRKYAMIPMDHIKILNSRTRDKAQFEKNVRSIKEVGLLKPVLVNERSFKSSHNYELICGEGRFLAYKALGKTEIPAEVVDFSKKDALLYSLIENIARVPPGTMWFAREIKRMYDSGCEMGEICNIVGKSKSYIADLIGLVKRGEDRLIKGVEKGLFSMSFASKVAVSKDSTVQNILMDAFDSGMVNCRNIPTVRKIIELRIKHGKGASMRWNRSPEFNVSQLTADIRKKTKEKESYVHQAEVKENRLITILNGLNNLGEDEEFMALLNSVGLDDRPVLKGEYNV